LSKDLKCSEYISQKVCLQLMPEHVETLCWVTKTVWQ